MKNIKQFLEEMKNNQVEDMFYISIPGKYNSVFVFVVVFVLIFVHYLQSWWPFDYICLYSCENIYVKDKLLSIFFKDLNMLKF